MTNALPILSVVVTNLSQSQPPSLNVAAMPGRRVPSKNQCTAEKFLKYDEVHEVEKAPSRRHLK